MSRKVGRSRGSERQRNENVTLPPAALAVLNIRQSDVRPAYVPIALQPEQDLLSRVEIENPQNLLQGPFDYTFGVGYVLPLFLLAISYSIVSVDLENGTLALLLAQGTPLRRLLVARIGVRFGAAMCCVFLSCVAALLAGPSHAVTNTVIAYLLLLLTGIAFYTLFWLVVSLLVQVLCDDRPPVQSFSSRSGSCLC